MNESFRIQFTRNGQPWPIDDMNEDLGLVMSGETDISPRSLAIEFEGDSPATIARTEWVRERFGWNAGEFKLKIALVAGELVVTGEDPDGLPPGLYWVQIHMDNIVIPSKHTRIEIKEGTQNAVVPVPVTPDPREVQLTTPIGEFDRQIRELIDRSTSLDQLPAAQWLMSPSIRAGRKACLLNLLAKLRTAPTSDTPLIRLVRQIIFGTDDRIYLICDPALLDECNRLSDRRIQRFYAEGKPQSPTHQRLLNKVNDLGFGRLSIDNLRSFRQEGGPSMQLVITSDQAADGARFVDADLDLGNPLQDLSGFVVHMGELISGKTTDHLRLRDKLTKGATAPFIYYSVT